MDSSDFNNTTVIEYLNDYLKKHKGSSQFMDSYASAIDYYKQGVNEPDKQKSRDLLTKALDEAKKCQSINDDISHWFNPAGLIMEIEDALKA